MLVTKEITLLLSIIFEFVFLQLYICDSQLQELNNRFKVDVMELLILSSSLDLRDDYSLFKIEDICKLANQFYPNDFTEQEKIHLKFQLLNYEIDILKHPEFH